jgi:hypothetical protein
MSKYSDNMNNSVGKLRYFLEVRKRCVTDEKSVVQNKSFRGILGYTSIRYRGNAEGNETHNGSHDDFQ